MHVIETGASLPFVNAETVSSSANNRVSPPYRIATVVGARPQFIKAAAVSAVLRHSFSEILIHTGQHFDSEMSDVFFKEMSIPTPDYFLDIQGETHGTATGKMLIKIEDILLKEKPHLVLIYGDTNSTLAGALSAAKLHIPIAHVEAGLRSYNRKMPEEINRIVSDVVSDVLFAPSEQAQKTLHKEGIDPQKIFVVGDVMYDAVLHFSELNHSHRKNTQEILKKNHLSANNYILATIHRAENTDDVDTLASIFKAFSLITETIPVVMPLHPRTRKVLESSRLMDNIAQKITILSPVGYLEMLALEKNARMIITDSGGIQKEAYYLGIPCITVRTETEWVELVEAGWNILVSPKDDHAIVNTVHHVLDHFQPPSQYRGIYGDGQASIRITQILRAYLQEKYPH
jgi:UDP-GlcNAc3NAcA epimerase